MSPRARRGPEPLYDGPPGPVLVRTVFERFPVTVKGAFVLRGGDRDPHVARIAGASVARTPTGPAKPIVVETSAMDIAPRRDLFLPFEATISDLDPGWYVVRCDLQVDGGVPTPIDSRSFSMPWPRATMASGSVSPAGRLTWGARALVIERLDLRADRVEAIWHTENWSAGDPVLAIAVDGTDLEALPASAAGADPGPERRRSAWYPARRGSRSLTISVGVRPGPNDRLVVPLV
jgi:hypothetical protein